MSNFKKLDFLLIDLIASSITVYGNVQYFHTNLNGAKKKFTNGLIFLSFAPRLIVPSGFVAVFAMFLYSSAKLLKPFLSRTLVISLNFSFEIL